MTGLIVALAVVAGVLFIVAFMGIRIIRPYQKGLVERLGKYQRTADSGLTFIIPFFEIITKVDIREQVEDVPPQAVICKDNVVVSVDAVVYYEVTDPYKFAYNVADYYTAITKLAQTSLRNLIGDLDLDDALTSRELINTKLREILDDATDKWGTRVSRVEIQRIEPPKDVTEAMHRQMKAERDRRAIILESEGEKQAKILRAEGDREAEIQRAVGQAEAIRKVADAHRYELIEVAEGEAGAIKTVFGAIHEGDPTNDLIAIRYLDTLARVADGKASKIFLPMEVSGILGSIGGIAELFGKEAEAPGSEAAT
ncbi:MAG: SPFH/Band 7/PHB domain protein [Actinomycetota bacterium]|nr:SPFH/Band 7/PHB domain protein [Actinomycetota bacterium]MDD5668049.1 SPFH/Band 7/PHB domain protein [Actinomycetota bacterium]